MKHEANREESICIRLCDDESAFVYTLCSPGNPVESREVPLRASVGDDACEDGYYGGSQTMD